MALHIREGRDPMNTKIEDALWDERTDIDSVWAAQYAANAEHEIRRISQTLPLNIKRLTEVTELYTRYKNASQVAKTLAPAPVFGMPQIQAESDKVAADVMQSARKGEAQSSAASGQDPRVQLQKDTNKAEVAAGSNSDNDLAPLPATRNGVPRCPHHPSNPSPVFHHLGECTSWSARVERSRIRGRINASLASSRQAAQQEQPQTAEENGGMADMHPSRLQMMQRPRFNSRSRSQSPAGRSQTSSRDRDYEGLQQSHPEQSQQVFNPQAMTATMIGMAGNNHDFMFGLVTLHNTNGSTQNSRQPHGRFLHVAVDENAAITELAVVQQRLQTLRTRPVLDMHRIAHAEQELNERIRVVAAHHWQLRSVPPTGPPFQDEHMRPNLAAMALAHPSVIADNVGKPLAQARGHGPHWCPWCHRHVNHCRSECTEGLYWEGLDVSIAQLNALGIGRPNRPGPRQHQTASQNRSRNMTRLTPAHQSGRWVHNPQHSHLPSGHSPPR